MIGYYAIPMITGTSMSLLTILYFYLAKRFDKNRVGRSILAFSHFPVVIGMIMLTVYVQRIFFRNDTSYVQRVVSLLIFVALYTATGGISLVRYLKSEKKVQS